MGEHLVYWDVRVDGYSCRTAILQARHEHTNVGAERGKGENGGPRREVQVRVILIDVMNNASLSFITPMDLDSKSQTTWINVITILAMPRNTVFIL